MGPSWLGKSSTFYVKWQKLLINTFPLTVYFDMLQCAISVRKLPKQLYRSINKSSSNTVTFNLSFPKWFFQSFSEKKAFNWNLQKSIILYLIYKINIKFTLTPGFLLDRLPSSGSPRLNKASKMMGRKN